LVELVAEFLEILDVTIHTKDDSNRRRCR
jgi:hypothetical protein